MNQSTPLAVDAHSRFMVGLFDEREIIGVPTAGQAFFGAPESGSRTLFSPDKNVADIDIIRGDERLAAMIRRGSQGRILNKKSTNEQNYSSFTRSFPLIEEEGDITADQLLNRMAGENPYATRTRRDRMREMALSHHMEHMRRTIRTCELLSWESLLTGKMSAIIGTTNADLIYDFRRTANHTVTVSTAWNGSSPDILGDIDGACDKIRANGHVTPDMIVMGGEAMGDFVKDDVVSKIADNRRIEWVEVGKGNPVPDKFKRFVEGGFTARGRLRTPKGYELWIFTYVDVYTADDGTATKYMPDDQALIACSGARCDRYFGPGEVLPMTASDAAWRQEVFGFSAEIPPMPANVKGSVVHPAMFYCDGYPAGDRKKVTIRTQAAPVFVTTMTDCFVTLKGLHT